MQANQIWISKNLIVSLAVFFDVWEDYD